MITNAFNICIVTEINPSVLLEYGGAAWALDTLPLGEARTELEKLKSTGGVSPLTEKTRRPWREGDGLKEEARREKERAEISDRIANAPPIPPTNVGYQIWTKMGFVLIPFPALVVVHFV